jgi:tetratricopeptide (TPR) repeat protein
VLVTSYAILEPREEFKVRGLAEAQKALELNPNSGEAHEAVALYLDRIDLNYEAAAKEYDIARKFLPNDSDLFRRIGLMQRRQGHWKDGLANVERAASLDPRNILSVGWLAGTYEDLGRWTEAEEYRQRCLTIALTENSPDAIAEAKFGLGQTHFLRTSDPSLWQKALAEVPADVDTGGQVTQFRYDANMFLRDFDAAEKVLERSSRTVFENPFGAPVTKAFLQGTVAAARGDSVRAKQLFETELPFAQNEVQQHPDSAKAHVQLGIVYAYLGRREEALREGRRAQELLPESQDAYYGLDITYGFARICARLGDADLAMPLIERLLKTPRGIAFQDLRFGPDWDPLRKDARFQKLVTGAPPQIIYQ